MLILHRRWVIILTFVVVSAVTAIVAARLPNIYTASTVIMVDPQKVPESYVRSTVTGDVRARLGTLSQQILSTTRLQKIIDSLNLYAEEKNKLFPEEIVTKMRKSISTTITSDAGGSGQDLQAFRITYRGSNPRQVAQVANQLASFFIDENLKAREKQASDTTDFLGNQLQETRKTLEEHEAKLRDFKMKHLGEMPDQLPANLQISGQLQMQLRAESEALARAEQQKTLLQSMAAQSLPVVDTDTGDEKAITGKPTETVAAVKGAGVSKASALETDRAQLAELLTRYKDTYPDVVRLKNKIRDEEARAASASMAEPPARKAAPAPPAPPAVAKSSAEPQPKDAQPSTPHFNPVLQSQLQAAEGEIAKHREEQARLTKLLAGYQARLEAIPVREQEITALERDYAMSKVHYSSLLDKQLSAETATQLEIREKGEKFIVLDPAVAPQRPTSPNRPMIIMGGCLGGIVLGFILAIAPELRGVSIISASDMPDTIALPLLATVPVIETDFDRVTHKKRRLVTASAVILMVCLTAIILYHYRAQFN